MTDMLNSAGIYETTRKYCDKNYIRKKSILTKFREHAAHRLEYKSPLSSCKIVIGKI